MKPEWGAAASVSSVGDMGEADNGSKAQLHPRLWLLIGLTLMVFGIGLAALVERSNGVSVSDVRFKGADGTTFSALVYRPALATAEHPAPGILAVHGYINTRETQSPFAIEFARRGYVVVALDQRGHGSSGGSATTKGFGGPEGLAFLRTLPFVDKDQIGLEGHSMGGWAVLAAAASAPNAYRAVVLEGSSTGKPFAALGTPTWPRDLEVVYSRYDEFAPLMWGTPRAASIGSAEKLKAVFGVRADVEPGRVYGDVAAGTARKLTQPFATHPGDHISTSAVADAADWFALTLSGGSPRARSDQVWWWKEIGTGLALGGAGALTIGLFDALLATSVFASLHRPQLVRQSVRDGRWWAAWALTAFVPAITYFCLPLGGAWPLKPSATFPQSITNSLMIWAIVNALLALLFGLWPGRHLRHQAPMLGRSLLLALVIALILYGTVTLAALVQVDLRFWVVALRPLSRVQALAALSYVIPFTFFVVVAFRGLGFLPARSGRSQSVWAAGTLSAGFLLLTGAQYVFLFATGALPISALALNTIVAIQFVPLLMGLGLLASHSWRQTGSYIPGALLGGLLVTWYMVAGTATHFT